MTPDPVSKYPLIAAHLRARIESGELAPGDQVPSENELAGTFATTRGTARRALDELHDAGLIVRATKARATVRRQPPVLPRSSTRYRRPGGQGPTSHFAADALAGQAAATWTWETTRVTASEREAQRLGVAVGDPLVRTAYLYRASEAPMQTSVSWEPLAVTGGTEVEEPEGDGRITGVIARMDAIGVRVDDVVEVWRGRPATERERGELEIPPGVWVWDVERTHYAEGRAVEIADIVMPQDRYVVEVVTRVP